MNYLFINLLTTCFLLFFALRKILGRSINVRLGVVNKEPIELLTLIYRANLKRAKQSVLQEARERREVIPLFIRFMKDMQEISLTTENLTLQISNYNNEKLWYQLFDMQGKQLSNGQVTAQQTQINMNGLPSATYFINVVNQENKKVQSFKSTKN